MSSRKLLLPLLAVALVAAGATFVLQKKINVQTSDNAVITSDVTAETARVKENHKMELDLDIEAKNSNRIEDAIAGLGMLNYDFIKKDFPTASNLEQDITTLTASLEAITQQSSVNKMIPGSAIGASPASDLVLPVMTASLGRNGNISGSGGSNPPRNITYPNDHYNHTYAPANSDNEDIPAANVAYFVTSDGSLSNDGASWNTPTTLEYALSSAQEGEIIWVSAGTYSTNVTFALKPGVKIYGGFAGNEVFLWQRNLSKNMSILDGANQSNHVVTIGSGEGNSTNGTLIDGFKITGGNASASDSDLAGSGAGVLVHPVADKTTIRNCIISQNKATVSGGGLAIWGADGVAVVNSVFVDNEATSGGAILAYEANNTVIVNCTMVDNKSTAGGHAVYAESENATSYSLYIVNSIFDNGRNGEIWTNLTLNASYNIGFLENNQDNTKENNSDIPYLVAVDVHGNAIETYDHFHHFTMQSETYVNNGLSLGYSIGPDEVQIPIMDQTGIPRSPDAISRGANEFVLIPTIFVAPGDSGDGSDWASAFSSLTEALNKAEFGDVVFVAKGTYTLDTAVDRSFIIKPGVRLYGGFDLYQWDLSERNLSKELTVLSSTGANYHVVTVSPSSNAASTVINGFKITGGNASGTLSEGKSFGGGIYALNGGITVENCVVAGNKALSAGGGFYGKNSNSWIQNSAFSSNESTNGAGIYSEASNISIINSTFAHNDAGESGLGAGVFFKDNIPSAIVNCTFTDNEAEEGKSVFNSNSDSMVVANSILWNEGEGSEISLEQSASSLSVTNCVVKGGYASGTEITTGEPYLAPLDIKGNPTINKTNTYVYSFSGPSSAIGYGLPAGTSFGNVSISVPTTDQMGRARPIGENAPVTAGAYEAISPKVIFVTEEGSGSGNSWEDSTSLQSALADNSALEGYEIWVAAGRYTLNPATWNDTFELQRGMKLYGGFKGDEMSIYQRDIAVNPTILDGEKSHYHVVTLGETLIFEDSEALTSYNNGEDSLEDILEEGTLIDGFTIIGGSATGGGHHNFWGAGVYVNGEYLTMSNCIVHGNMAEIGAGIMINSGSKVKIANSLINGNFSLAHAAAIGLRNYSALIVENCSITNNTSSGIVVSDFQGFGSGIFTDGVVNLSVVNSSFINNIPVGLKGSAVFSHYLADESTVDIANCLFVGYDDSYSVIHNEDPLYGASPVNVSNSLFYKDLTEALSGDINSGNGLVSADAMLVLYGRYDSVLSTDVYGYNLKFGSPAIGVGLEAGSKVGDARIPAIDMRGTYRALSQGVTLGSVQFEEKLPQEIYLNATLISLDFSDSAKYGQFALTASTFTSDDISVNPVPLVKWTTTSSDIAAVSETGVVSAAGTNFKPQANATIRGILIADETKYVDCSVIVIQRVTSMDVITGSLDTIKINDALPLSTSAKPSYAYNTKVKWQSDKPLVASVSESGVVTGKGVGTATITAYADDDHNIFSTYSMTVVTNAGDDVPEANRTDDDGSGVLDISLTSPEGQGIHDQTVRLFNASLLPPNIDPDALAPVTPVSVDIGTDPLYADARIRRAIADYWKLDSSSLEQVKLVKVVNGQTSKSWSYSTTETENSYLPLQTNFSIKASDLAPELVTALNTVKSDPKALTDCLLRSMDIFVLMEDQDNALHARSLYDMVSDDVLKYIEADVETSDAAYTLETRVMLFDKLGSVSSGAGSMWVMPLDMERRGANDYFIVQDGVEDNVFKLSMAFASRVPFDGNPDYFVASTSRGSGDGSSWDNATNDLKGVLNKAGLGDIIWVAEGTYSPGALSNDYFPLRAGIKLYGGFAGTEVQLSERNLANHTTVLDGANLSNNILVIMGEALDNIENGSESDVSEAIGSFMSEEGFVYSSESSVGTRVDGFTITGGYATTDTQLILPEGGSGIINLGSSMSVIANCTFINNNSTGKGAALASFASKTMVENCVFLSNSASIGGAAYSIAGASSYINCTFYGNEAIEYGGSLFHDGDNLCVVNCTFKDNIAPSGNTLAISGDAKIVNSILWNQALNEIYKVSANATFNVTSSISQTSIAGFDGIITEDPILISLDINGDPIRTIRDLFVYAVDQESSAFAAGLPVGTQISDDIAVPAADQRRLTRPLAPANVTIGSYEAADIKPTGVELNHSVISLDVFAPDSGQTAQLEAIVLPRDTDVSQKVIWSSANSLLASVDSTGLVTALSADATGRSTVNVTATTEDGSKSAICAVVVTQRATGFVLDSKTKTMSTGETTSLFFSFAPANTFNKKLSWSSSDPTIATVSDLGLITAINGGSSGQSTVRITATTGDGSFSDYCDITVSQTVTGINVTPKEATINVGDKMQLMSEVLPSNAFNKNVVWSSSSPSVASVATDGTVEALSTSASGQTTVQITASTAEGNYVASSTLTVVQKLLGISLDRTGVTLKAGETITLKPTFVPSNAYEKSLTWKSSNPSVASVSDGVVSAKSSGTASITATAIDGGFIAFCTITVYSTSIALESPKFPSGVPSGVNPVMAVLAMLPENSTDEEKAEAINELADKMPSINRSYLQVDSSGYVSMKPQVVNSILNASNIQNELLLILPVFEASVPSGQIAAVSFPVRASALGTSDPSKVKLVKIISSSKSEVFTYVDMLSNFADKTFTILNSDNANITEDKMEELDIYHIVLFVKDGGSFDLDNISNGSVIDPLVILKPDEKNDPISGDPEPSKDKDSNSGCNSGLSMAGLILLLLGRKKKS